MNQQSCRRKRPMKNVTSAKLSRTPRVSFAGPMLDNNASYEDSCTTCPITPEKHGSLFDRLLKQAASSTEALRRTDSGWLGLFLASFTEEKTFAKVPNITGTVFGRKTLSKDFDMAHHMCTTQARMPADAPADAGRPLQRTTADAKNPQKKAADAFPAFEKYKVIERNPPCGCPMGCVAHCMGGMGFSGLCCCPSETSSR